MNETAWAAKNAKMTNEIWRKPGNEFSVFCLLYSKCILLASVYDNIMDAHIYSVYNIYYEG